MEVSSPRRNGRNRFTGDLARLYEVTRNDIFAFARWWNFHPTDNQQRKLMEDVQRRVPRIAVKSGHGTGKTAASCIVGAWRAWRRYNGLTLVTAPTGAQCREVFLAELTRLKDKADPIAQKVFDVSATRCSILGERHWGIKTRTAVTGAAFAGFHEGGLSIIFEEAGGIENPIWVTSKGALTNADSLFLAIGNPVTLESAFYRCFTIDSGEYTLHTFNSRASKLVEQKQCDLIEREFGEDSDEYRVRVLGEFPFADPSCVLNIEDVHKCILRDPNDLLKEEGGKIVIAMDFARFGGDENVIIVRVGNAVVLLEHYAHRDPNDVLDRAFALQDEFGWRNDQVLYVFDCVGVGEGIARRFSSAKKRAFEFKSSETANDSKKYKNRATEAWFALRLRYIKPCMMSIPDDRLLATQLSTRMYKMVETSDQFRLEPKNDYKARGYMSPDRADALAMAFYPHATVTMRGAQMPSRPGLYEKSR